MVSPTADIVTLNDTCYLGLIPQKDVNPLLTAEGDFLLRKTEFQGNVVVALEVRSNQKVHHFIVNQNEEGKYYFESHSESGVEELIKWHQKTQTPLSESSNAVLKREVKRPGWILNPKTITMIKKLGEGAFGEVYLAEFTNDRGILEKVAVKSMREYGDREARMLFMKEARIMRGLQHPNVVRILGIVVDELPLLLLMEVCSKGSALSYVRKNRGRIENKTKLRFIMEASAGLAYMESLGCIHRDIAARNCLLTDDLTVKISDFGMSEMMTIMRLEKLAKAWEIYSEGLEPYPTLSNAQTRAKIIVQNYRMTMPKGTQQGVCDLIADCWKKDPLERPTFSLINEKLKAIWTEENKK